MKLKTIKRLLCLSLVALLVFMFTGCQTVEEQEEYNRKAADLIVPDADANDLRFEYDADNASFTLTDTRNNYVWSSQISKEYYGRTVKFPTALSLFRANYIVETLDAGSDVSSVDSFFSHDRGGNPNTIGINPMVQLTSTQEGNKVTINVYIEEVGGRFDLILELKGNTLVASVPAESIKEENESCRLESIALLPGLGASHIENEEGGYVFYPDGAGTLFEFGAGKILESQYKKRVYGDFFTDYDQYIKNNETGVKQVMLPVMGVRHKDADGNSAAILSAVTKGQSNCSAALAPDGQLVRTEWEHTYRYGYIVKGISGGEVEQYEDARATNDFEVQYTFLANEDADYSGMARTYRSFLLKNGLLNNSTYTSNLSLDFLLSLQKPLLLWTENVAASTFNGGADILQLFKDAGISGVKMNLLGWQKDGYNIYPSHFPISSSCGGASQLKSLLETAKSLGDWVSLNDNFIISQQKLSSSEMAYSLLNQIYIDGTENNFLLDYRTSKDTFINDWIKNAKKNNIDSVNLDDIARVFYANGKRSMLLNRDASECVLSDILKAANDNFSHVGVSGGNLYGLKYADFLYDVPESSSQDFRFDREVPFFQMVVHGAVAYSSEIPGNFSSNYDQTFLKWIEYGFVPYFSISESSATDLKDCYSEGVLISKFSDCQEKIMDAAKLFNEKLASLQKASMVSHEYLSDTSVQVKYSNGVTLKIDYKAQTVAYQENGATSWEFTMNNGEITYK